MSAIVESGLGEVVALYDPLHEAAEKSVELAPTATRARTFEDLLELDLDGIVVATPSALHASQAIAALQRGRAVFCQKPLGRTCERPSV